GRIPKANDQFDAEGIHVQILAVEGLRIRRIRVSKRKPYAVGDANSEALPLVGPHGTVAGRREKPANDREL
ncbi:MAG: hypothetical protein M3R06_00605, partial [Chloroflexota bacterium]|nr:hypothetical protein [Chloroflexota bacterium]